MSDSESIRTSSEYSSNDLSGNETDSENEESYEREIDEMIDLIKNFNQYMYEPEKNVSDTTSTENDSSENSDNELLCYGKVGIIDWCECKKCLVEKKR